MSVRVTADAPVRSGVLRRYADPSGARREIVLRRTSDGGALVIDRVSDAGGGGRLVAHLAADEPPANALLALEHFLAEPPERRTCRTLSVKDLLAAVADAAGEGMRLPDDVVPCPRVLEAGDERFAVAAVESGMSIPALRWCALAGDLPATVLGLRQVVSKHEAYEPACAITRRALGAHAGSGAVSSAQLRAELERLSRSSIVLNRGLREAVLAAVARGDASMSEIAIRCGRRKKDPRGNISGETSWLSRRLGLLPEGGHRRPTPWIHSDVLALIARQGLGVSPGEVEL